MAVTHPPPPHHTTPDPGSRDGGNAPADSTSHADGDTDAETGGGADRTSATDENGRDTRTAGQRRHDALLDILTMVERAEQLPNARGISTTILLTMDADTYTTTSSATSAPAGNGTDPFASDTALFASALDPSPTTGTATRPGMARTGHGYLVPAHLAKRWAGGDTRIIAVLLSTTKAITAYSSTQRIFTEQQRLALIA